MYRQELKIGKLQGYECMHGFSYMKDINTDTANIVLLISDFLWLITYLLKQTATARK